MRNRRGQKNILTGNVQPENRFHRDARLPVLRSAAQSLVNACRYIDLPTGDVRSRQGQEWRMRVGLLMAVALGTLALGGCGSSSGGGSAADIAPDLPQNEASFVSVVEDVVAKASSAQNYMQKGGFLSDRNNEICRILSSAKLGPSDTMTLGEAKSNALMENMISQYAVGPRVQNWIGKIDKIDSNSDGKGVFYVSLSDHVKLETWNNDISDASYHTLIDPSSPLFSKVSQMKVGECVVFSGYFFMDAGTCIKETSLSLDGKIDEPEFLFKFEHVDAYDPSNPPPREESKPAAAAVSAAPSEPAEASSTDSAASETDSVAAPVDDAAQAADEAAQAADGAARVAAQAAPAAQ